MSNHSPQRQEPDEQRLARALGSAPGDSTADPDPAQPLFEPGSMVREVAGEALALLGGGRAILLQLAHPLVSAGVAQHGSFQQDTLGRLLGTLQFVHSVVFGTGREALRAADSLKRLHTSVKGKTRLPTDAYSTGTPYDANDPHLSLWVFTTLIDSSLVSFQRFVRPLSGEERARYYAQSLVLARLLEVPDELTPETLPALHDYMREMMTEGPIEVTQQAKELAREVLYPQLSGAPALSAALLRFVTAGIVAEPLRSEYGLCWTPRRQLALDALSWLTRTVRPWAPRWVWQSPLLGPGIPRYLLGGLIEESSDRPEDQPQ